MVNYSKCPCCTSERIKQEYANSFLQSIVNRCENCSFRFNDIIKTENNSNLSDYYKNEYWNSRFSNSKSKLRTILRKSDLLKFGYMRARSHYEYVKKFGRSVLDVGAGEGLTSIYFSKKGFGVVAIEPDSKNVKTLKIKYPNIKVFQTNFEDLQLNEKFDIIIMSHVLEHVFDIEQFLISLKNLLTDKGILFIEVPNCSSKSDLERSIMQSPHLSHFTKKSLESLIRRTNFKIRRFDVMYLKNELTIAQHALRYLKFHLFRKDVYENSSDIEDTVLRTILTKNN